MMLSLTSLDQTKTADRTIGLLLALSGGVAFFAIRSYFHRKENLSFSPLPGSDEIHSVRYALLEKLTHNGSCHCQRIQFRIRAPRIINGFDMQSKVRFPRLVLKCEDFENMSDENNLSLYAVTNGSNIGIHAFCSYCGVHILFSPAEDPKEIQINVDCLDRSNIEKLNISYYGKNETIACDLTDARARLYTRTRNSSLTNEAPVLPPSMKRNLSGNNNTIHHDLQMNQLEQDPILDSDYCSESLSELLVEGVEDADSEKEFSQASLIPEERREIMGNTVLNSFPHSRQAPGNNTNNRYRSNRIRNGSYPTDWEREAIVYNSWNNNTTSPWIDRNSNSNSLSNSYTTTESGSVHDSSLQEERKGFERSPLPHQHQRATSHSISSVGLETPTTALHRRLKTFLRRHMPQDQSTSPNSLTSSSFTSSSLASHRYDQQQQQQPQQQHYDPERRRR